MRFLEDLILLLCNQKRVLKVDKRLKARSQNCAMTFCWCISVALLRSVDLVSWKYFRCCSKMVTLDDSE